MRGTYLPPKKEPKEGERKLYLAIEATSELAIQKAKSEVTRLIKEELVRLVGVSGINMSVWVILQISPKRMTQFSFMVKSEMGLILSQGF